MNDTHELFKLGVWSLQQDTFNKKPIASIRHLCEGLGTAGRTLWFYSKTSIIKCYCGASVPEDIQTLCVLFNLEWVQEADLNG